MNVYTDPQLLDVETALDSLPQVSLDLPMLPPNLGAERGNGEGTSDTEPSFQPRAMMHLGPRRLKLQFDSEGGPDITPTSRQQVPSDAHSCTDESKRATEAEADQSVVTRAQAKKKALFAGVASKASKIGMTGFEPATSTSRTYKQSVLSRKQSEVTATPADGCTTGCTSETEIPNDRPSASASPVAAGTQQHSDFAAALAMIATLALSDTERAEAVRRLLGYVDG